LLITVRRLVIPFRAQQNPVMTNPLPPRRPVSCSSLHTPHRLVVAALAIVALASCGGSGGDGGAEQAPVTFVFRLHGLPQSEEFRATIASPKYIAMAREQLLLPEDQRHLFANGGLLPGNGGYNLAWSWHFGNVGLSEVAIELCDGRPSFVEANLDYWLNTVKGFCPWASYVYQELP
jgi:hypothetical protein